MPNNNDGVSSVMHDDRIMTRMGPSSRIVPLYIGSCFEAHESSLRGARTRALSVIRIQRSLHHDGTDHWLLLARYHTLSSYNDEWIDSASGRVQLCQANSKWLAGETVRERAIKCKWRPFVDAMIMADADRRRYLSHEYQYGYVTLIGAIMGRDVAMVICTFMGFTNLLKSTDDIDDLA